MNFTKKIAAATAAIALTASFASAQAVIEDAALPLDFAITKTMVGEIVFTPATNAWKCGSTGAAGSIGNLAAALNGKSSDLTCAAATGCVKADIKCVGIIEVKSDLAAWDVIVNSNYGGVLTKEEAGVYPDFIPTMTPLKTMGAGGAIGPDAKINLNTCVFAKDADPFDDAATVTNCPHAGPTTYAQMTVPGPITGYVDNLSGGSIANANGKASFGPTDVGDDNTAFIVVEASIPYHLNNLVGNGTYEEEVQFTLQSVGF